MRHSIARCIVTAALGAVPVLGMTANAHAETNIMFYTRDKTQMKNFHGDCKAMGGAYGKLSKGGAMCAYPDGSTTVCEKAGPADNCTNVSKPTHVAKYPLGPPPVISGS